jgi:RimJ/RimL family protein N-acetyltransferase
MHEVAGHRLRKPEARDVEALFVFKNDPEIGALLGGHHSGYSRADLASWVEFHRNAKDEVLYVITDGADTAIGHVGLYKIDPRIGMAEFAIVIGDKSRWGKGLGRACTRFMIEYGFSQLNLRRIYLEVLETNPRAADLYRSLGFVDEGRLRQAQFKSNRYLDVIVMGLLRDEYRRAP